MYFGGLHSRLSSLYDCDCDQCRAERINLAASGDPETEFKSVLKAAEKAFKYLHENGGYRPEDITAKAYQNLIDENYKVFDAAITDNEIPQAMQWKLQNDAFIFSGLRTHAQLMEAATHLRDEKGHIRSFDAFAYEFNKINKNYNQNYLHAEYQFAISSSQQAANWAATDPDGRYNLQYRTAGDDRVRVSHQQLNQITLPKEDDFWLSYYPPNGWRCRCVAVEVRKSKYDTDDPDKAMAAGEKATTQIGRDGKNKLEIFRFNPGAEMKVFPPKHPYNKVKGAKEVTKKVKELKNAKDLSGYFSDFAQENKQFFARGFKQIKITRSKSVNGSTDMNGDISLKSDIVQLINEAINSIKRGEKTTFEQEQAISTLHHELWHNANKHGNMWLSKDDTQTMELANEFVSRKTLPEFMKKLGGNLENTELTNSRKNTAYNKMVVNYDHLISWAEADPKKVLNTVKDHLINAKYDDQMTGLVKGITENSKYSFKESTIKAIIKYAKDRNYDAEKFKKLLENNKNLLQERD